MNGSGGGEEGSRAVCRAFGMAIAPTFALPELGEARLAGADGQPDVVVELASPAAAAAAFSGPADPPVARTVLLGDGCTFGTERGTAGDLRVTYGDRATFTLTTDSRLLCAPVDVDDVAWRRFLLDSALGTAALRHRDAIHAGGVLRMEGVWAVAGDQGAGKSTLVAELLRRGERLFTDDLLFLAPDGGAVVAHAGPPVMNLPPRLPDGRSPSDVGRVLADIDGEAWVAVPAPAVDVAPLAVVVLLDRGDHDGVTVTDDGGLEHLLAHSLGGSSRERMASRFSLLADLVATTPVLHVRADAAAPASRVVDAVEHHLVDHGVAAR